MKQNQQKVDRPNPNAPAEPSRFAFLIGRWRFDAKFKSANEESLVFHGTWLGRYILNGYAIADEYRMIGQSGELIVLGMNFRIYDSARQVWNIKWLNALEEHGRTSRRNSSAEPVSTASPSAIPLSPSVGRSGPLRAQPTQISPRRISLGAVKSFKTRKRGLNSWSWSAIAARTKERFCHTTQSVAFAYPATRCPWSSRPGSCSGALYTTRLQRPTLACFTSRRTESVQPAGIVDLLPASLLRAEAPLKRSSSKSVRE